MEFWNFVMALATAVNLIVAIFMWLAILRSIKLTKTEIELSYRPLIGIIGITLSQHKELNELHIKASFHNFGKIPAKEFEGTSEINHVVIAHDRAWAATETLPIGTTALFPGADASFRCIIKADALFSRDPVLRGRFKPEITLEARYKGVTDVEHTTTETYRYDQEINGLKLMKCNWT